ncbi:hypothetical protein ACKRZS_007006 [Fusarium odoratissimum]
MASATGYYQHQPLPTHRSIRLLRLQPNPSRDEQLRCTLEPVSLDKSPKYWGLSYTWDAQAPSHPIICQEEGGSIARLDISPNCAAALRQVRNATEERILWVDGICINQASLEERSSQVALMGEIYHGAERVVVWLGESDPVSEQAIDLLKRIGEFKTNEKSIVLDPSKGTVDLEKRKRKQKQLHGNARKLIKNVKSDAEDVIGPFFRRNWFYRMWTVQEVVLLSPEHVDVYCGETRINWFTILVATDMLGAIEYRWGDWEPTMALLRYLAQIMIRYRVPDAKLMMDNIPGLGHDLMLSQLLIFCRPKLATDPKDKVYAVYGLLDYLGVELPNPDYEKSLAEIYAEITAICIKYDKDLFLLSYVPSEKRRPGLPSWVPDWSDTGWAEHDARYPLLKEHFAASGTAGPEWRFTPNPQELIVYGKVIDTVKCCTESFAATLPSKIPKAELDLMQRDAAGQIIVSDILRKLYSAFKTLQEWVEVAHRVVSYPTGESVDDALMRTLLGDIPPINARPEVNEFGGWLASMRATEAELDVKAAPLALRLCTPPPLLVRLQNLVDGLFRPSRALEIHEHRRQQVEKDVPIELRQMLPMMLRGGGWRYHCRAVTFSANKSFFRTDGDYFGLAPDLFPGSLQTGDVVALVAGMAMPVVLRRAEGGFNLVSHCYVHGMMYGEIWERVQGQLDELMLI